MIAKKDFILGLPPIMIGTSPTHKPNDRSGFYFIEFVCMIWLSNLSVATLTIMIWKDTRAHSAQPNYGFIEKALFLSPQTAFWIDIPLKLTAALY